MVDMNCKNCNKCKQNNEPSNEELNDILGCIKEITDLLKPTKGDTKLSQAIPILLPKKDAPVETQLNFLLHNCIAILEMLTKIIEKTPYFTEYLKEAQRS